MLPVQCYIAGPDWAVLPCCRHPSGIELSVQSLKKLFASTTAVQASDSWAAMHAEIEDISLEYAAKRALTAKVRHQVCCFLHSTANVVQTLLMDPSSLAKDMSWLHIPGL